MRQPSFNLTPKTTPEGIKLAHKLCDFLSLEVGKQFDSYERDKKVIEWAVCFDSHIAKCNDYEHLCGVFDFYVSDWRKRRKLGEHPYVYLSASQFLSDLYILVQKRDWSDCPIPEEELEDYLKFLRREPWVCTWESLVVAVSKSVYNFKLFFAGLKKSKIKEQLKLQIGHTFGDLRDYIVRRFMGWRYEKSESVWVVAFTQDKIFEEVRKMLAFWGYSNESQKDCLEAIQEGIKEVKNADNDRN